VGLILRQQLPVFYPDGRRGSGLLVVFSKYIPMGKVFNAFAKLKGVEASEIRFLWCGEKIGHFQTLGELQLDGDWDCIDCVLGIVRLMCVRFSVRLLFL
jgi:phosphoribosyl-AMP cyclohydrolase